jgi:hypothetical protein
LPPALPAETGRVPAAGLLHGGRCHPAVASSGVSAVAGAGKASVGAVVTAKVTDGSQMVYLVDDGNLAWMEAGNDDFTTTWLEPPWDGWLANIAALWTNEGLPAMPWLPRLSDVDVVEVIFCCNLTVLCDRERVNAAFRRGVVRRLSSGNKAAADRIAGGLRVEAGVMSTLDVAASNIGKTVSSIRGGYGRRFGDPFKDMVREIYRFLDAAPYRRREDSNHSRTGSTRKAVRDEIRAATAGRLLDALGIGKDEVAARLAHAGATERTATP